MEFWNPKEKNVPKRDGKLCSTLWRDEARLDWKVFMRLSNVEAISDFARALAVTALLVVG